jgi:hypothetical protein
MIKLSESTMERLAILAQRYMQRSDVAAELWNRFVVEREHYGPGIFFYSFGDKKQIVELFEKPETIRTISLWVEYIPATDPRMNRLRELRDVTNTVFSEAKFVIVLAADVKIDNMVDQPRASAVLHKPDPFPATTEAKWHVCSDEKREARRKWANKVQTLLASYSMKGKKMRKMNKNLAAFVLEGRTFNSFVEIPGNKVLFFKGEIRKPDEPEPAPTAENSTTETPKQVPEKVPTFIPATGPVETKEALLRSLQRIEDESTPLIPKAQAGASVVKGEASEKEEAERDPYGTFATRGVSRDDIAICEEYAFVNPAVFNEIVIPKEVATTLGWAKFETATPLQTPDDVVDVVYQVD